MPIKNHQVITVGVLAAMMVGCGRSAGTNPVNAGVELSNLSAKAGLVFPTNSKLLNHGDGGGRDASYGFYSWTVFSPSGVALPKMKEAYIANGYLEMPLDDSVRLMRVSAPRENFADATKAISTSWETNAFEFGATVVRTPRGDYVQVNQGKRK